MAKNAAKAKTKGKAKGKGKEKDTEKVAGAKYGISDLADRLDIGAASCRVKLRKAGIEKVGGRYGWDTKADLSEVVDQLKSKAKEDED